MLVPHHHQKTEKSLIMKEILYIVCHVNVDSYGYCTDGSIVDMITNNLDIAKCKALESWDTAYEISVWQKDAESTGLNQVWEWCDSLRWEYIDRQNCIVKWTSYMKKEYN